MSRRWSTLSRTYSECSNQLILWHLLQIKVTKRNSSCFRDHNKQEKSSSDRFLALKFFEYEITDNKPIMDQVHEIQMLISKLSDLDIKVPDSLQMGVVLLKLLSSWNEYRKKMLHSTYNLYLWIVSNKLANWDSISYMWITSNKF